MNYIPVMVGEHEIPLIVSAWQMGIRDFDAKKALEGSDVEAIKAATEEVQKAFYAVSEKLYKNAAPQGEPNANPNASQAGPQAGGNDDGVVDADYEEVKDN